MKPSDFLNRIPSERLEQHNMTRDEAAILLNRLEQAGVQVALKEETDRVKLFFYLHENS